MSVEDAEQPSVGELVFEWATALPSWQQDAVVRLIDATKLSDEEASRLKDLVLESVGLATLDVTRGDLLEAKPEHFVSGTASPLVITGLGQLKQIGQVSEQGSELSFGEGGITVVFGGNGAGKTSYARTLKYVGKAAGERPKFHSSIHLEKSHEAPQATLRLSSGGESWAEEVDLTAPSPTSCSTIRAFDSKSAGSYISGKNPVDFTPRILRVFDRLGSSQREIGRSIQDERKKLESKAPSLEAFHPETQLKRFLQELTADSGFSELQAAATLTEDESRERDELMRTVGQPKKAVEEMIGLEGRKAEAARKLGISLSEIVARVGTRSIEERIKLRDDAARKSNAASEIERDVFAGAPEPDLSPDAWREMWKAVESYVKSGAGESPSFPPVSKGNSCPLCFQGLDQAARDRFAAFQSYLSDKTSREAAEARRALADSLQLLKADLPDCRNRFLKALPQWDPELAEKVNLFLDAADERLENLRSDPYFKPLVPQAGPPLKALDEWAEKCDSAGEKLAEGLTAEVAVQRRARLDELEDKMLLGKRLDEFKEWHTTLRRIARLRNAEDALSTTSITNQQRKLSKKLIEEGFQQALLNELQGLDLRYISIDIAESGSEGSRIVKLKWPDETANLVPIEEVLSEGEQRALALAYYFAEVEIENLTGPLVLDDPVSSFDMDRRELVARRVVEAAKHRQVIVFTHDIPFVYDIEKAAKGQQVPYQLRGITRRQDQCGLVENDGPMETRKAGAIASELTARLSQRPEADLPIDRDRQFVDAWYADLRKAWERAVENDLLQGVVRRFSRDVRTDILRKIRLSQEKSESVEAAMSQCSRYAHSSPESAPTRLPSTEQMKSDVVALEDFLRSAKAG